MEVKVDKIDWKKELAMESKQVETKTEIKEANSNLVPTVINSYPEPQNTEVIATSSTAVEKSDREKSIKILKAIADKVNLYPERLDSLEGRVRKLESKAYITEVEAVEAQDNENEPEDEPRNYEGIQIGLPTLFMDWD
jgi:hypothetical protein